jgi:hypothetical protein
MKLWMSGELWWECDESYRNVRKVIESTFNQNLSKNNYGKSVEQWAFIAIIRPPDLEEYDEIEKYHKRDKSLEFRLRIDYFSFKDGDKSLQKKLICNSLLRCLDSPVIQVLPDFNHKQLKEDFIKLCENQGWL